MTAILIIPSSDAQQLTYKDLSKYATVRITSHGCSGTIVGTWKGRTRILTCAHAFLDGNAYPSRAAWRRQFVIDVRAFKKKSQTACNIRLVAIDYSSDLALIEMSAGPYEYFCLPVKSAAVGGTYLSTGYDQMQFPPAERRADKLKETSNAIITRQIPVPGRSGGPLIDAQTGYLVGTCIGYYSVDGRQPKGIYSHPRNVVKFMRNLDNYTLDKVQMRRYSLSRFTHGPRAGRQVQPYFPPQRRRQLRPRLQQRPQAQAPG